MYFRINLLAFFILLSLNACSDNVPTTIPLNADNTFPILSKTAKLHIDVLSSPKNSLPIEMILGEGIELLATLEDQNGESLPNQSLAIASANGNFLTENNLLTDHDGQATSLLLATIEGKDVITVTTSTGLAAQLAVVVNTSTTNNEDDTSEEEVEEVPDVILN